MYSSKAHPGSSSKGQYISLLVIALPTSTPDPKATRIGKKKEAKKTFIRGAHACVMPSKLSSFKVQVQLLLQSKKVDPSSMIHR
jgi:hypothetical protein